MDSNLTWTASKTDLVELIYALRASRAIGHGKVQVKHITSVFEDVFNVELGNCYKTYAEIKNRNNEKSRYLAQVIKNFNDNLDLEDSL